MHRKTIRLLVILSTVSIIAVIITQIYWVRRAFVLNERQFVQTVHTALQEVAEQISELNGVMLHNNPVEQLSTDFFVVNTNTTVEASVLRHYLQNVFAKYNLVTDYEVGIYDCTTNKIRYGMALSTRTNNQRPASTAHWLKTTKYPYYFGVRFPSQASVAASSLRGWIWSSVLVLVAIGFFGYAIFVILRQKQLTEVQRDFINNMTHELQTPIATIKIAADVLSMPNISTQPERFRKYTAIVKDEVLRLQHQVETVLNMARAEKNQLELKSEWIDLHQVITTTTTKYEGKVSLLLNAQEPYIDADRFHLNNLITNLVDNAFKYSPDGAVVEIITSKTDKTLTLSVRDNGIGIAPEHQKLVFKKFYRVPTGNLHNVKGFGIGLSYVWQIVKAHGWRVELDSQVGQGSRFRVIIPLGA